MARRSQNQDRVTHPVKRRLSKIGTHGEREALRVAVRRVLVVKHVVEGGDLAVGVRNLWCRARVASVGTEHHAKWTICAYLRWDEHSR